MTENAALFENVRAIVFQELIHKADPAYYFEAEDVVEILKNSYGVELYSGIFDDIEKMLLRLYGSGIAPHTGKTETGRHRWKFGKGRPPRSNLLPVPGESV